MTDYQKNVEMLKCSKEMGKVKMYEDSPDLGI